MRQGPSPPTAGPFPAATGSSVADTTTVDPAVAGSVVADPFFAAVGACPAAAAPAASDVEGSSSVVPAYRRYHTRAGPTPPAKRAWTSGLGD